MNSAFRDPPDPGDEFEDLAALDALDEAHLDAELADSERMLHEQIGSGLAELVSAPADLASRTAAGVGDALLTRSTLSAALDLMALGWHTVRYLAGDTDPTSSKETDR